MAEKTLESVLQKSFYRSSDVLKIAENLIGKVLNTQIDGIKTSGIIVETEAYAGIKDRASHAYKGRRTDRTETMYAEGGCAYVYLCYGIHSLFNVVTNSKEIPDAVLIRGIYPFTGIEMMKQRVKKNCLRITDGIGPGKVSALLGINCSHNKICLTTSNTISIAENHIHIEPHMIHKGTRIGIDYAGPDAALPYRFYLSQNSIRELFS